MRTSHGQSESLHDAGRSHAHVLIEAQSARRVLAVDRELRATSAAVAVAYERVLEQQRREPASTKLPTDAEHADESSVGGTRSIR